MACSPIDERMTDLHLVQGLLADRQAPWSVFLGQSRAIALATVRRTLLRYGASPSAEDTEDILHELWLSLLHDGKRKLRTFAPERGLRLSGWIALLARHATIDWLREREPPSVPIDDGWDLESEDVGPEDGLAENHRARLARVALAHLSEEERAFLSDCLEDDLTPREIARQHRMSVSAVYTRKCRVIGKLTSTVKRLDA